MKKNRQVKKIQAMVKTLCKLLDRELGMFLAIRNLLKIELWRDNTEEEKEVMRCERKKIIVTRKTMVKLIQNEIELYNEKY